MPRLSDKQYQRQSMLAMTAYVAVMLGVWPLVRTVTGLPLKVVLALAPVLPMLYVIGLMARVVRDSDELEQRTHLLSLGVATAVVGVLSLVGGFLAAGKVLRIEGDILIWVFPVLMFSYSIARGWVGRRYGMSLSCEDEKGMPIYQRCLWVALLLVVVAALRWSSLDDIRRGFLCGATGALVIAGMGLGVARRLARPDGEGRNS